VSDKNSTDLTARSNAAVVLAAGMGTRMKSALHKVLQPIAGRPMIHHLLASVDAAGIGRRVIVVGAGRDQVMNALPGEVFAVQDPQHGTGHAVSCARQALIEARTDAGEVAGDVLVLYGDVPFVAPETMAALMQARRVIGSDNREAAVAVLGFRPNDPAAYGRMIQNDEGELDAIVEFKDANEQERAVGLCNSGIMSINADLLFDLIDQIDSNNAAGEFYLTDIVALARRQGHRVVVVEAPEDEVMGINSMSELAKAESVWQRARRAVALEDGVRLVDPDTVWFAHDTVVEAGAVIFPNVFFGPGVRVGSGTIIFSFSHLEGCRIGENAAVGPYARMRPGADLGDRVKVGNFVEIKKASIEAGAKISHLSYIGDARVGENANIGAGTITCNYNGYEKFFTDIGKGAFIGSNSALVAPVKVGDGAIIGAGSTITKDVECDALSVTRAEQKQISGWAMTFRSKY